MTTLDFPDILNPMTSKKRCGGFGRCRLGGILSAALLGLLSMKAAIRADELPPELQDVGEHWLEEHWKSIVENRDHLIVAYGIGSDEMDAFLHIYYDAWRGYRDHLTRFAQSISLDDTPEESQRKLLEFDENSPVSERAFMALAESILPKRDFAESRSRFSELNSRATALRYKDQDYQVGRERFLKELASARESAMAIRDESGRPIPLSVAIERGMFKSESIRPGDTLVVPETVVAPTCERVIGEGVFRRPAVRKKPIVKAINDAATLAKLRGPVPAAAPAPLIDPAEDDWVRGARRMAREAASRPGVTESQRAVIAALLDEILARADATRRPRASDYLALERLTSRSEFSRKLAELDEELDGLWLELQGRLSAL
ncbi:MAG: hypothetical protein KF841_01015 [Phycisphaerae bacterium]|nr:hypothetical protein [Phycisphaerae bacterium]